MVPAAEGGTVTGGQGDRRVDWPAQGSSAGGALLWPQAAGQPLGACLSVLPSSRGDGSAGRAHRLLRAPAML